MLHNSEKLIAMPMPLIYDISDLRERPEFSAIAADRIWNAWWREQGVELAYIEQRVGENFHAGSTPLALVAHDGERFLGTASIIDSDMEERPELSPWVAAVWVEPEARSRGIGAALVNQAASRVFAAGFKQVYLCATPENSAYYERLGWAVLERDVAGLNIFMQRKPDS